MKLACTAMADPMQSINRLAMVTTPGELLADDVERMFCPLQPQHRGVGLGEQLADLRATSVSDQEN